ncbi:zf-C3HC-domain-containing protein [Schizopora paradoxa]|uniref:Zf-C3HC-domain-containing protein n=1 Tax=Schizopora paradoxa TaxID=27342 RepID=A0A0H2RZV5_9AGAM|nr:zf-C3HC-domain-containing protein [Schizopora paradoxa]
MAPGDEAAQPPLSSEHVSTPSMNDVQSTASTSDASTSTTTFNPRVTKRKIESIFHSLDESLLNTSPEQQTTVRPAKKARHGFSGSIYSTLAKYGIRTSKDKKTASKGTSTNASDNDKEGFIAKTAPHLSSILQRAASKRWRPPASTPAPPVPGSTPGGTSEYSPSSLNSFLTRLATFKLTTYSPKPSAIDAVAASRCGWTNDGKDRLVCSLCHASWTVTSRDGMTKEAANALLQKQISHMVEMHKEGCPWKVRQCDPSIYCVPLKAPATLAREVKSEALKLTPVMEGIEVRHPLTSIQLQNLVSTVKSVQLVTPSFIDDDDVTGRQATETQQQETSIEDSEVSESATLTSLFGWSLTPTASSASRPSSPSVTRAPSLAPPSAPVTPRRTSGRFASSRTQESTPTAGPSRPSISHLASSSINMFVGMHQQKDTNLVQCVLCQRRVGLWAFKVPPSETQKVSESVSAPSTPRRSTQKRQFDVLKEHRSYCPYVARSTTLPGPPRASMPPTPSPASPTPPLPTSPTLSSFNFTFGLRNAPSYPSISPQASDKVEGWRAALTIVLRTGLGRRQRQKSMRMSSTSASTIDGSTNATTENADAMEVDNIQAMVEDVKARGGRDLLKYVKGLFG